MGVPIRVAQPRAARLHRVRIESRIDLSSGVIMRSIRTSDSTAEIYASETSIVWSAIERVHDNDGSNGSNSGHVRLYEWDGNAWVQLGSDIDGEAAGDASGNSVSLSSDGTIVAIGARNNDGNGSSADGELDVEDGGRWRQEYAAHLPPDHAVLAMLLERFGEVQGDAA